MDVAIVGICRSRESLEAMMACLFTLNKIFLTTHPNFPELYSSGIRYRREPRGLNVPEGREERWDSIPVAYRQGWGDCDDLAPWRAAELVVRYDVEARPIFEEIDPVNFPNHWHVLVEHPDGSMEDPSEYLGMYEERRAV